MNIPKNKNKAITVYSPCCCCLVTKSSLTLRDPIDCSPPGSSVHGISQARILVLPFPIPGDLPNWGLNLPLLHWQVDSLPRSHLGSPYTHLPQTTTGCQRLLEVSKCIPQLREQFSTKKNYRDFPGGPEAKTLSLQCRGSRFNPWSGSQVPQATTKTAHSQINNFF